MVHALTILLYRKRKKSKYTTSSNDYVKYKPSSSKAKSAGKKKQSGATGIQLSEKEEKVEDDVIDEQCYENTSFIGKQLCVHDYSITHLLHLHESSNPGSTHFWL